MKPPKMTTTQARTGRTPRPMDNGTTRAPATTEGAWRGKPAAGGKDLR